MYTKVAAVKKFVAESGGDSVSCYASRTGRVALPFETGSGINLSVLGIRIVYFEKIRALKAG